MYVVPPTPPVISPVAASIVAPSLTAGLNVNVPPTVPVTIALLPTPTQKSDRVNEASSRGLTVTVWVLVAGHSPVVVY